MKISYDIEILSRKVDIPDQDIQSCKTREELEQLIEESIEGDFRNNVYPYWDKSILYTKFPVKTIK